MANNYATKYLTGLVAGESVPFVSLWDCIRARSLDAYAVDEIPSDVWPTLNDEERTRILSHLEPASQASVLVFTRRCIVCGRPTPSPAAEVCDKYCLKESLVQRWEEEDELISRVLESSDES